MLLLGSSNIAELLYDVCVKRKVNGISISDVICKNLNSSLVISIIQDDIPILMIKLVKLKH